MASTSHIHLIKASYSTRLIHDYLKTGNHKVAHSLFNLGFIRSSDIKLYGLMMKSYLKNGETNKMQILLKEMQSRQIPLNDIMYLQIIKCIDNLSAARAIHSEIEKQESIYRNIKIQNSLIALFSKLEPSTAMDLYRNLCHLEVRPSLVTFLSMLKVCGRLKDVELGMDIHREIKRMSHCQPDIIKYYNAVITMYQQCDQFELAMDTFNEIRNGNVPYCKADDITYLNMIKCCASFGRLIEGKAVHRDIDRLKYSTKIQNALINMYVNGNDYVAAMEVFDGMKKKDALTYCLILKGCGKCKDYKNGRRIHKEIKYFLSKHDCAENAIWIYNSLCLMYGRLGDIKQSERLWRFINDAPKYRNHIDIASIGAMMNAYVSARSDLKALELFEFAKECGHRHNDKTIVTALMACCHLNDSDRGTSIYDQYESKTKEKNVYIQNALKALNNKSREQPLESDSKAEN